MNLTYSNKPLTSVRIGKHEMTVVDEIEMSNLLQTGKTFHVSLGPSSYFGVNNSHAYYYYLQRSGVQRELVIERNECSHKENQAIINKLISQMDFDLHIDEG